MTSVLLSCLFHVLLRHKKNDTQDEEKHKYTLYPEILMPPKKTMNSTKKIKNA